MPQSGKPRTEPAPETPEKTRSKKPLHKTLSLHSYKPDSRKIERLLGSPTIDEGMDADEHSDLS